MHDRKLLLEVREMVLDLTHHGRRASPKGGAAAAGAAAATLQQEAVALAAQLERKLDPLQGQRRRAAAGAGPTGSARLLSAGSRAPLPPF